MSTAKRSKRRQAESQQPSASPLPATKRLKSTHVPAQQSGLGFLVDEDARAGKKIEAKLTNGVPRSKSTRVDESHAGVAPNTDEDYNNEGQRVEPEVIDISSGEEESSELPEDDEDDEAQRNAVLNSKPTVNGHLEEEEEMEDAAAGADDADMADADEAEQQEEPTFGDLLQARHPDPIDVRKSLQDANQDSRALAPMSGTSALTTGHSLGTVLTQALKNNDKDLLETCFGQTDLATIRSTIQRQKSHEIGILLERIAERIYSKPGRTGNLLVWVHWSLICHGGYLANQPELMKKVKALAQVVRERAAGLQPLLHLKGKLDLLHSQLELRHNMQDESRGMNAEDMDDPQGVLYIEGEDHESSDSDDAAEGDEEVRRPRKVKSSQRTGGDAQDEEMDLELPNGQRHESSEDEDDVDLDGLVDNEAEEGSENDEEGSSSEEADSEEEEDEEDDVDDESENEESDTIAVKQPKPNTLNRKR